MKLSDLRAEFSERRWSGPAWAVYLCGIFHSGVYFTKREAENARKQLVADSYERLKGYGSKLRYWQSAYQVDRVSVVATPSVVGVEQP